MRGAWTDPTQGRWTVIEYAEPAPIVGDVAARTGMPRSRVRDLLLAAGDRVARALGLSESPLQVLGDGVRAVDFAGLLVAGPGLELEVAPKFLGAAAGWREDFFFLATLSRHGRLLDADRLRASGSRAADLATLVGRALAGLYWDNHRRPLRTYRRATVRDFAIEGDVDADALTMPDEDGFEQVVLRYDRANPFNAAIRAASAGLAPVVRDPELRAQLERVAHVLAPQTTWVQPRAGRVPSRAGAWQPAYDLAIDVLRGLGLSYAPGGTLAPGYVVHTWRAWEKLLAVALRMGLGGAAVTEQPRLDLGTRDRGAGRTTAVRVTPDLLVAAAPGGTPLVADAKYKGRVDQGRQRVAEADLYEALAFSRASGCTRVALFYPKVPSPGSHGGATGGTSVLETLTVGPVTVVGIEVEVRGISAPGGLRMLAGSLGVRARALTGNGEPSQAAAEGA